MKYVVDDWNSCPQTTKCFSFAHQLRHPVPLKSPWKLLQSSTNLCVIFHFFRTSSYQWFCNHDGHIQHMTRISTLNHTTFNCQTQQGAKRMMENNTTLTTPQHGSQVFHLPYHPHQSTFIHTWWTCGDISYVNGCYQYRQVTSTVCYNNIMLHSLNIPQKQSFLEYCESGSLILNDYRRTITLTEMIHLIKVHIIYKIFWGPETT